MFKNALLQFYRIVFYLYCTYISSTVLICALLIPFLSPFENPLCSFQTFQSGVPIIYRCKIWPKSLWSTYGSFGSCQTFHSGGPLFGPVPGWKTCIGSQLHFPLSRCVAPPPTICRTLFCYMKWYSIGVSRLF